MPSYFSSCILDIRTLKQLFISKKLPTIFFLSLHVSKLYIQKSISTHPIFICKRTHRIQSNTRIVCFSSSSLGEGKNVLQIPMYSLTDPGQMSKWLRVCFWCRFSHLRYPKNIPKSQCLISCSRCHCAPIWALVKQDQEKVYQNPFACYLVN